MRVRLVTINLRRAASTPDRAALLNGTLHRLAPDLLALQELTSPRQLDVVLAGTDLAHRLTLDTTVAAIDGDGGTALATRWPHRPIDPTGFAPARLSALAAPVPWWTLAARVSVPALGELLMIATTSSWGLEQESFREWQAVAVAELDVAHRAELPTILAGDFNATPDAASLRFLTGRQSLAGRSVCYRDADEAAGSRDWPADRPAAGPRRCRGLEHVLLGSSAAHPKARVQVERIRRLADEPRDWLWVDDHYGLLVDLDVSAD